MNPSIKHKHRKKKHGGKYEKPLAIKGTLEDILKAIAKAANHKIKNKK